MTSGFFCFFFSSRRRHTRWPRDWSSDVCSSDLDLGKRAREEAREPTITIENQLFAHLRRVRNHGREGNLIPERSEERRVGKSVDLGGCSNSKKKKKKKKKNKKNIYKKKSSWTML